MNVKAHATIYILQGRALDTKLVKPTLSDVSLHLK